MRIIKDLIPIDELYYQNESGVAGRAGAVTTGVEVFVFCQRFIRCGVIYPVH